MEQHAKFVTTEARQRIFVAQAPLEELRDLTQHLIAGEVAANVVNGLEAVEVDKQHAALFAARLDRGKYFFQLDLELTTIE